MRLMAWISTIVVIAILYVVSQVFWHLGTEISLAFGAGFFTCYVIYKNWRQDNEDEKNPHFTD